MQLTKNMHIHFIGIGGIGMSALASYLTQQGFTVSGCDLKIEQKTIYRLKTLGCTISLQSPTSCCSKSSYEILVYSSAIPHTHPELEFARKNNLTLLHRADLLAYLINKQTTIAVTGSHGKTTTSALLSHLLLAGNHDPSIIIGGDLATIQSNAHAGKGKLTVIEADESDRSFLKLSPYIAIITSLSEDHLNTYRDIIDIQETFIQFCHNIHPNGFIIAYYDDPHICTMIKNLPVHIQRKVITYGHHPQADVIINHDKLSTLTSTAHVNDTLHNINYSFTIHFPGTHNLLNTTAALTALQAVGLDATVLAPLAKKFTGVDRRFSFRGTYQGARLIDDYAHHPREINHALQAARQSTQHKLIVLFQPHRYTRTQHLWDEFLSTFGTANIDHLIITDIYPASEPPICNVTSKRFVAELRKKHPHCTVCHIPLEKNFRLLQEKLSKTAQTNDVILFLGAGCINQLAETIAE